MIINFLWYKYILKFFSSILHVLLCVPFFILLITLAEKSFPIPDNIPYKKPNLQLETVKSF